MLWGAAIVHQIIYSLVVRLVDEFRDEVNAKLEQWR